MEDSDILAKMKAVPEAIEPPVAVGESAEIINLWRGQAALSQGPRSRTCEARVFVDTLPHPTVRFELLDVSQVEDGFALLRQVVDGSIFKNCELACDQPLGTLTVHPGGWVDKWATKPTGMFTTAKLLVINGPWHSGNPIKLGSKFIRGRLQSNSEGTVTVTVDPLAADKQSKRSVYAFTHVAEIRFREPQQINQFEEIAEVLFKTLSLMRGRWVGLVGPWFYVNGDLKTISPQVTKTTQNGSCHNWCCDNSPGVFEDLFAGLQDANQDSGRREILLTGIYTLIESQLCAIECAIIVQQAALEAFAWFEIVQTRKLCSSSGFENLPAADKIRWLASLYKIPITIPAHESELANYAKAYNHVDLLDILVDVRNALVHGSPKKIRKIFDRPQGDDERINLWYLSTGLLEQVVLAIAGYRGMMLRRDVETPLAVSAVKQVPWT